MAQSNLAYDLERFEAKTPGQVPDPKPRLTVRSEKTIHPVKIIVMAVMVLALAFTLLYSRVILNELDQEILATTEQLNVLQAESVRMQTDLEGKMSLKAIETAAIQEYGMVKPDSSQVEYIQLQKVSKIEAAVREQTFMEKLMEYLENLLG